MMNRLSVGLNQATQHWIADAYDHTKKFLRSTHQSKNGDLLPSCVGSSPHGSRRKMFTLFTFERYEEAESSHYLWTSDQIKQRGNQNWAELTSNSLGISLKSSFTTKHAITESRVQLTDIWYHKFSLTSNRVIHFRNLQ